MGATAPLAPFRSRWSLNFIKKLTIFEVSSTKMNSIALWLEFLRSNKLLDFKFTSFFAFYAFFRGESSVSS